MSDYLVGIDLGTTHTVVAYAPLAKPGAAQAEIRLFDIVQSVAPGEVTALPLLPSCRYHAAEGELAADALPLPWRDNAAVKSTPVVKGQWARQLGAQAQAEEVLRGALKRSYDSHLVRLSDNTQQSIETSSLHIDLIHDLKRINSHICSIAYPILESAGALAPNRLREPSAP